MAGDPIFFKFVGTFEIILRGGSECHSKMAAEGHGAKSKMTLWNTQ